MIKVPGDDCGSQMTMATKTLFGCYGQLTMDQSTRKPANKVEARSGSDPQGPPQAGPDAHGMRHFSLFTTSSATRHPGHEPEQSAAVRPPHWGCLCLVICA